MLLLSSLRIKKIVRGEGYVLVGWRIFGVCCNGERYVRVLVYQGVKKEDSRTGGVIKEEEKEA